jgi:geranylgeranyl transferase type-2 subunit alpha
MENELHFLETCLKVNPKSYGTWHHRSFILENIPNPDWARELELCNKFLEYDERNCKFNICVCNFFLFYGN